MIKYPVFLLALLFPIALLAQIAFQQISFPKALKRSAETGQLIFLQFESSTCNHCNEVANKAFENKELSDQLEQTFICIKITPSHTDRETIGSLFNIKNGFGSLFIDQNKTLIHSFPKSTTQAIDYKDQIGMAIYKAGEEIRISELEKEYKKDNNNIGIMELLLKKRKSLNLETDSLLDAYVSILPPDSLKSVIPIVFIAQMAPVIGSKGDFEMHKNHDLFNKAWYTIPLSERLAINNLIIYKSMKKAVKEKNEAYAYRVASFARSTYTNHIRGADKAFDNNMINFYKEINDTINYMIRAVYYYDNYYMTVSVDSIKRMDSLRRLSQFKKQTFAPANKGNTDTFRQVVKKLVQYTPIAQSFTKELNKAAWNFYKITNDPQHISKALQWAKRANDFFENPEAMDTYARLLYKSGNKNEAINWEEKAIYLQVKRGFPITEYEATKAKMKQDIDKID